MSFNKKEDVVRADSFTVLKAGGATGTWRLELTEEVWCAGQVCERRGCWVKGEIYSGCQSWSLPGVIFTGYQQEHSFGNPPHKAFSLH